MSQNIAILTKFMEAIVLILGVQKEAVMHGKSVTKSQLVTVQLSHVQPMKTAKLIYVGRMAPANNAIP
jgi:hypothetical protein